MTLCLRDPIHGSIFLEKQEIALLDHPIYQRLRNIKQLGFADLAFPGATHTRYCHSVGAMEVSTRMFDAIFNPIDMPAPEKKRLRTLCRLALLLHDLGHAPGSHASENAMPLLRDLHLPYAKGERARKQASHEDFTVKLCVDSSLTEVLEKNFKPMGITPAQVAHLICEQLPVPDLSYTVGEVDYFPLLSALVSSEMDADRMDYLQRDAYYAGVSYGHFDQPWLLENLCCHIEDGRAYMALQERAVMAYEDFLLSRYHMFASVYHHPVSVCLERMLAFYYRDAPDEFDIPADSEAYAKLDDVTLWMTLRNSQNKWAKRICARKSYACLYEQPGFEGLGAIENELCLAGVPYFVVKASRRLSKYDATSDEGAEPRRPLYVKLRKGAKRIEEVTPIYKRYAEPNWRLRIYVDPDHRAEARALIDHWLEAREK